MGNVKVGWKKIALNNRRAIMAVLMIAVSVHAVAQDGNLGITAADTAVRSYFKNGVTLMYGVGALVGLIGAVKVFQKWNSGDQDTSKVASAWFGSCIFLVVVATVMKGFFNVTY